MMLKFLLVYALTIVPALSDTLLSGATYFDSKNTLLEVEDLIKSGDTNGLVVLIKAHHISEKVTENQEVIILVSGSDPSSPVEFRFVSDPTTYWTYAKYITANGSKPADTTAAASPSPSLSPGPRSTLPADLPSSLTSTETPSPVLEPTSIPTPTPTPPPAPMSKAQVAVQDPEEEEKETLHPPLIEKHHRRGEEGVPESAKVWHLVNGRWKWVNGHWKWVNGHWKWLQ